MPWFLNDGIVHCDLDKTLMGFQNVLLSLVDSGMKNCLLAHLNICVTLFLVFLYFIKMLVGIRYANFFGLLEQAITFTHMLDDISSQPWLFTCIIRQILVWYTQLHYFEKFVGPKFC